MTNVDTPRTVRRIGSPAAGALAELAGMFEDLQTALLGCERLMTELAEDRPDALVVESVWTTVLMSYTRCFAPGGMGMALTEDDVTATGLQGEVLAWHGMLRQLRKHYADPAVNPRESFRVGVTQSADGTPNGVAITSISQALVDQDTVRQTGALALALSRLVDSRIGEHQGTVLEGARALSPSELATLEQVDLDDVSVAEASGEGSA